MKYLIDTNLIIDLLRGDKNLQRKLQEFAKEGIAISVISLAEIIEGAYLSQIPKENIKKFQDALSSYGIFVVDIDTKIAETYGIFQAIQERKGNRLSGFDMLIAASCIYYDLFLISQDKAFKAVEELKLKII